MYCSECGTKLDVGDAYCHNCGKRIEPEVSSQPYDAQEPPAAGPYGYKNNNRAIAITVAAFAFVVIAAVLIRSGLRKNTYQAPYSYFYSEPQGQYQPPDYAYGDYSFDDSYESENSYGYGGSSQICTSCSSSGHCDFCHGTGQTSMYGSELDDCSACGGTGICSICGGDGVY